jgi:uracil-DNA glycosylase family 4
METRVTAIRKLNRTLKFPKESGGNFLPPDAAPRFDLMFVSEMPSMRDLSDVEPGKENINFLHTGRDLFLQEMIVKYGAAGSYVTDVVKTRSLPRRPTKAEVLKWLPFLLREVAIIQPRGLIVLGKRTYEHAFLPYVTPRLPSSIRVDYVFHYSSQVPKPKFEERFGSVVTSMLAQSKRIPTFNPCR